MAQTPPPDLVASAAREARNMFLLGLVCLPFGAVLTAFGAVAPCFLILGPLILLGGFVMIPFGAYQWFNPMSHSSIRRLGKTPEERARAVDEIEAELKMPDAEHYSLSSSDHLTATPHWLVRHGSNLFVTATRDVLWAYKLVTTKKKYGVTVSTTVEVVLKTRHSKQQLPASEASTPAILGFIARSAPAAFYGYDAARERLSGDALAKLVDARLAGLGADAFRKSSQPAALVGGGSSPIPDLNPSPSTSRSRPSGMLIIGGVAVMFLLLGACGVFCLGAGFMANESKKKVAALAPACDAAPVLAAADEPPGPNAHVAVFDRERGAWDAHIGHMAGVPEGEETAKTG